MELRAIQDNQAEAGYEVICQAVEWMKGRGISQWSNPLPREVYDQRQGRGENCALFVAGRPAVVLALLRLGKSHWDDLIGPGVRMWLATLATARDFHGQGYGAAAVGRACELLGRQGWEEMYLDCLPASGFLQPFYESLGFQTLARADRVFPHGTFDMVLMKRRLR